MFRFIRQSIARKIALVVGLSCLVISLLGLAWMIQVLKSDILEHSRQAVSILSGTLRAGFQAFDPESKSHPISEMIEEIAAREEIASIRIFDANGRIVWSHDADEPGTSMPAFILSRFRSGRTYLDPDSDQRTIGILNRVRAKATCLRCHAERSGATLGSLLGGVHLQASYAKLTEKLTGYGHLQIITALLLVAFVTTMTILMVKIFLGQPLRKLATAIEAAQAGNFLTRVETGTSDETARLAEAFNHLLIKFTDVEASKIDSDIELGVAHRELKYKAELEEKNKIIEETNLILTRRVNFLAQLYDVSRSLSSSLEIDQVLELISGKIGTALPFDGFTLLLTDEEQGELRIRSVGAAQNEELAGRHIDPLHGVFSEALRKRNTCLVKDLSRASRGGDDERLLPLEGSLLSIPLLYKNRALGLLNFVRNERDAFPQDAVSFLESLSQQAALALLNARLFQEKLDLSVTDELTKLANRRLLKSRLEMEWNRARRYENPLSLLMIDIDHFKIYNDRNGHLLGDKVLQDLAQLLESNTRMVDTVARFGGEEFVIVLPGQDKPTALSVADKLRRAVHNGKFGRAHSQPGGRLTISIGVSTFPEDADSTRDLLNRADLALYAAKRTGRDRTCGYQADMKTMEEDHRKDRQAKKRRRRRKRKPKNKMEFVDPT